MSADYQQFVGQVINDASASFPPNIREEHKQFILQTIQSFAGMVIQSLSQDPSGAYTAENIQLLVQYIAQWTFRKGVELTYSQIPPEHWGAILQQLAGGIFEIGKNLVFAGIDQQTMTANVEGQAETYYYNALQALKDQGAITEEQLASLETAKDAFQENVYQGEVDSQGKPTQEGPSEALSPKKSKLAALAVVLGSLPEEKIELILSTFPPEDVEEIRHFMLPENITAQKIDPHMTFELLKSLKSMIAPEEAPTQIARNITRVAEATSKERVLQLIENERPVIKNYIKSCLDGKFIRRDFPPYIGMVIVKYLQKELLQS